MVALGMKLGLLQAFGIGGLVGAYLDRSFFKLPGALLVYALILAVFWVAHLVDTRHREEVRRLKLEGELTDARLRTLEMQLHPHFFSSTP